MRRMSFSATIPQMHDRSKTVTRRAPNTWANLAPGDRLTAIEKGMGLAKGESQLVIGTIEIMSNRLETLADLTKADVAAEGFPGLSVESFLTQVWQPLHGSIAPANPVRRIEFRHVNEQDSP